MAKINTIHKPAEICHQCAICGAHALHSNFGVMTCSPCKMFFKRNAEVKQRIFTCDFGGNCEININTRHVCSTCRLAKCFANGMQSDLIRCSSSKIKRKNKLMTICNNSSVRTDQQQQLPTLNLLQAAQSIFTTDQWNRFYNLMHCHDEQSGLLLAERFISEQNILPFKLRFKCRSVNEFVSLLFGKAQSLFDKNGDFRSLCSHDRSILLRRQMKYMVIISSSFVAQQSRLLEHPAFYKAIETLFGTIVIPANKHPITSLSFDVPFLKLTLAIISFSSFDYTIYENISSQNLTNTKSMIQIQDMYIELAWRYLVCVYDDKQAVISFSNFIRCILTINDVVILIHDNKTFTDMIDCIVQRTEQAFIPHNE